MKERKILYDKKIMPLEEQLVELKEWEIKTAFDSEGYIIIILEREIEQ